MQVTATIKPSKRYGLVGFFGNNIMYRLRYVDKDLGNGVHKSLISQGYNSSKSENNRAIELEIMAPSVNKVLLSATINRIKRNYKSDPIKLKVNPKDNTITIKKVKDSYSREEVRKLCIDAFISGTVARNKIGTVKDSEIELKNMNIWLAENL